jgi:hypothetical protein
VAPFGAAVLLATGSSLAGAAALMRGMALSSSAFLRLLLGVFLGRVALVALFGIALYSLAPAHLAVGLLSLVGFHFVFAMTEVVLLARKPSAGPGRRETS